MKIPSFYIIVTTMLIMTGISNVTSIAIRKETRNHLASLGTKDSTFDEIIQKLITSWRATN